MSGHSKWSTIKHKKAAADAKRGKVFSKIAKEIMVSARQGGGDPTANIGLRALIQKARSVNMPADNIDRAVKKGTGELESDALEEIVYEGYAPGGVALVVEVLTDNRNRSTSEVKHAFSKHGGNLSGQGSVIRTFNRKGNITVACSDASEDELMELALEAGAEDFSSDGEYYTIITEPNDFMTVVDVFNDKEIKMDESEVTLIPETLVSITDATQAAALLRFVEALDDLEDVQNVYANFDMDDDVMQALEED